MCNVVNTRSLHHRSPYCLCWLYKKGSSNYKLKIHWTPGHANVNGNEIADRLAKEAAKEAEQNQSDSHNTITKQDVKKQQGTTLQKNGKTDGISVIEEDSTIISIIK